MRSTLGAGHDHILVYAKKLETFKKVNKAPNLKNKKLNLPTLTTILVAHGFRPDFTAQGYRPNQMYEITTPSGQESIHHQQGSVGKY